MALNPNPVSTNAYGGRYIKEVTLPSGNVYEIVDYGAREVLSTLANYSQFLGVVSNSAAWTKIQDGSTTGTILVGSTTMTATTGNIVIYKPSNSTSAAQEFIWDGTKWNFFGDIQASNLGTLAYKNSVSVTYTKFDSVNVGSDTVTSTGSFTPSGGINTGTGTLTSSGSFTAKGGVAVTTTTAALKIASTTTTPATANQGKYWHYTPEGSVSVSASASGGSTTKAYVSITGRDVVASIATAAPTSTVTGMITYAEVSDNNLKLNQIKPTSQNSLSASTSADVVKTVGSITASGSFNGTGIWAEQFTVTIPTGAGTFTGTAAAVSVTGTVINSITFSGTAATVTVKSSAKFVNSVTSSTSNATGNVTYSP